MNGNGPDLAGFILNYLSTKPAMIFPTIMIVLDIFAAIVYACGGEWKRAVYWIAASVLTWTVTY